MFRKFGFPGIFEPFTSIEIHPCTRYWTQIGSRNGCKSLKDIFLKACLLSVEVQTAKCIGFLWRRLFSVLCIFHLFDLRQTDSITSSGKWAGYGWRMGTILSFKEWYSKTAIWVGNVMINHQLAGHLMHLYFPMNPYSSVTPSCVGGWRIWGFWNLGTQRGSKLCSNQLFFGMLAPENAPIGSYSMVYTSLFLGSWLLTSG